MSRSFLFVPADSERKLAKARTCGADALILDLEDSVDEANRPLARKTAAAFLGEGAEAALWVRINPLDTPDSLDDLRAVMPRAPHGIVLPKPAGPGDATKLAKLLDVFEQEHGTVSGTTRILPIATERPAALFAMHGYAGATPRLAGLTWGAEDLSAALGASATRDETGAWLAPFALARSLTLLAAAAAGVPAVDTVYTDFRDAAGLAAYASASRQLGFEGMLAIHPDQVAVINDTFVPSDEEVDRARRIVELFEANPGAGTLGLDGEMLDRPHRLRAERLLEMAARVK